MRTSSATHTYVLLALIVALGAILRIWGLADESLWHDELETWRFASLGSLAETIRFVATDNHPPLYQAIIYGVERWIGEGELALRAPSVVAGILLIPAMFLLAKEAFGEREGIIAAAIAAFSWAGIFFSQEARSYSLLLLEISVATLLWLRMVRALRTGDGTAPSRRLLAGYGLMVLLIAYTHYIGLILLAAQALLLVVLTGRRALLPALVVYGVPALLYVPWVAIFLGHASSGGLGWLAPPESLSFALWEFARGLFGEVAWSLTVVILGILAVGALTVRYASVEGEGRHRLRAAASMSVLSIALAGTIALVFVAELAISWTVVPILGVRYLVVCLPFAFVLIARLIVIAGRRGAGIASLSIAVCAASMYGVLVLESYYSKPQKMQIREAVRHVIESTRGPEMPIIFGYAGTIVHFNYYFERYDSPRRVYTNVGREDQIDDVAKTMEGWDDVYWPKDIYYIATFYKPDEEFVAFLQKRMRLIWVKQFHEAVVMRFRRIMPGDTFGIVTTDAEGE